MLMLLNRDEYFYMYVWVLVADDIDLYGAGGIFQINTFQIKLHSWFANRNFFYEIIFISSDESCRKWKVFFSSIFLVVLSNKMRKFGMFTMLIFIVSLPSFPLRMEI